MQACAPPPSCPPTQTKPPPTSVLVCGISRDKIDFGGTRKILAPPPWMPPSWRVTYASITKKQQQQSQENKLARVCAYLDRLEYPLPVLVRHHVVVQPLPRLHPPRLVERLRLRYCEQACPNRRPADPPPRRTETEKEEKNEILTRPHTQTKQSTPTGFVANENKHG